MGRTSLFLPYYAPEKVFIVELALQGRYAEIPESLLQVRVLESGSGTAKTAKEQHSFATGQSNRKHHFVRMKFLAAYLKAIHRSPIGLLEKIRCYLALTRWLTQFSKWPRVIKKALLRKGLGGRNLERIKSIEQKEANLADENS